MQCHERRHTGEHQCQTRVGDGDVDDGRHEDRIQCPPGETTVLTHPVEQSQLREQHNSVHNNAPTEDFSEEKKWGARVAKRGSQRDTSQLRHFADDTTAFIP